MKDVSSGFIKVFLLINSPNLMQIIKHTNMFFKLKSELEFLGYFEKSLRLSETTTLVFVKFSEFYLILKLKQSPAFEPTFSGLKAPISFPLTHMNDFS